MQYENIYFFILSHSCLTASYPFPHNNYWVEDLLSSAKKHLVSTVHVIEFVCSLFQGPRGVPGIPGPQGPPGHDVSKIKVLNKCLSDQI